MKRVKHLSVRWTFYIIQLSAEGSLTSQHGFRYKNKGFSFMNINALKAMYCVVYQILSKWLMRSEYKLLYNIEKNNQNVCLNFKERIKYGYALPLNLSFKMSF